MPRPPQDVTDAELAVLQVLWEHGPSATRILADRLYPGGAASQYATVQKLLERLENKGFVRRRRDSSPQLFEPAVARDQLIGRRLRDLAEKLCGGSLAPLLTNLVETETLSPRELQSLRELIDRHPRKTRKPRN